MSDFRKPRADHPIYPKSAIYRPTTSKGFIVPKGLKGKKGGKKKKKGKKAKYDPEAIARVHQQTSRNKERELLQEQLDYRRAQRVVEEEQRIRAAELAEERRREERERFALEARQMRDQRDFFRQLGNAAAGIAAGVGARAGAVGGGLPHAGVAAPAVGGGGVIHLPDAPRARQEDVDRRAAQVEADMRAAAQRGAQQEVDRIRQEAAAEIDAARQVGRLSDERARRERERLEQRFAEEMEGLESRARAAEAQAQDAEAQVAAHRAQIEQLQQQVLEGRVNQEEAREALRRLRALAGEEELEPQGEGGGLVRQRTAVGGERAAQFGGGRPRRRPGEEAPEWVRNDPGVLAGWGERIPPLSRAAQERRGEERTAQLRTMAQDIQEEQGLRDSGWTDATQSLVEGGAFADYGVPGMDDTAQAELDQIRESLVFTDESRRERQRRIAAANARWFDFLERRRIESGARGTFRPKHSPSMDALSAQLALEDLGAQPEPQGGGAPRGPTPPPTEGRGSRPKPPGGRGGGSRGRSARNVVSREDSDAARRELQQIVDKPFLGGGEGPAVQHPVGDDPKSREQPRPEEFVPERQEGQVPEEDPAKKREREWREKGSGRPYHELPDWYKYGGEPRRSETHKVVKPTPEQKPPKEPFIRGEPDWEVPQPRGVLVEPHVQPEPQAEGGVVTPFGKYNIVRHKRTGRLGWVSEGGVGEAGGEAPDAIEVSFFKDREAARSGRLDRLAAELAPPPRLGEDEDRERQRLSKKHQQAESDRRRQVQAPTQFLPQEADRLSELERRHEASLQLPTDPHQVRSTTFSGVDEGDMTPEERLELLRQIGKQTNRNVRLSHTGEKQPFQERASFEGKRLWLESDDWGSAGGKAHYRLSKRAQEDGEGEGERLFIHSYDRKNDRWLIQREKGHIEGVKGAKKNTSGRSNISHEDLVRHLQAQQVRLRRDGDQAEGGGFLAGAAEAAGAVGRLGAAGAGMMGGAIGGAARVAWEAAGSPTARDVAGGAAGLAARAVTGAGSAAYEVSSGLAGLAAEGVADAYEHNIGAPARVARLPSAPGAQTGYEQTGRPEVRLQTESELRREAEQTPVATFRGSGGAVPDVPRRITDPRPAGVRLGSPVGLGAANEPPVGWGVSPGVSRERPDA